PSGGDGGTNGPGDDSFPGLIGILKRPLFPPRPRVLLLSTALRTSDLALPHPDLNATGITSLFAASRVDHRTVVQPSHGGWASAMIDEWESLFWQGGALAACTAYPLRED